MNDAEDMLKTQNRALERENRHLRASLRDQFALAALHNISIGFSTTPEAATRAAAWCYLIADEMLKARKELA